MVGKEYKMKPTDPEFVEQCNKSSELRDELLGKDWWHGEMAHLRVTENTSYNSTPSYLIWGHGLSIGGEEYSNKEISVNEAILPKGEYSVFWIATCNSAGTLTFKEGLSTWDEVRSSNEKYDWWYSANTHQVPWYNLSKIPVEVIEYNG